MKLGAPALLAAPAATALAADHLEGGQVIGMIVQLHETAGVKQLDQLATEGLRMIRQGIAG